MNAKTFFHFTLCAATAACLGSANAEPIPDQYKQGGFAIGAQAYSFKEFSVFEAIEKTAEAGGEVIEFYPGQKLSEEEPAVKFDHNSPPEVPKKVKAKCAQHTIQPTAYGLVGL